MNANLPVIPEYITVHLGAPDSAAQNVTLPFADYIKNVVSSEIYPTWPENAIRANALAIISFALNRVYTEFYRTKGYNFDITNDTRVDQAFVKDRDIYENVGGIVDGIFNNYIVRNEKTEPLFAQFCNGTTSKCNGLSQWGTVPLANSGKSPLEILKNYYGNDISIVTNAPVKSVSESFDGIPLKLGSAGNSVKTVQIELNRIARNYPAIPKIKSEDGFFGADTEEAVKKFQEIFSLPKTGIVDKSTWYKIKRYYNGVKQLSELISEGITLEEARLPFAEVLKEGDAGEEIRTVKYYLNVIAYFNPALSGVKSGNVFDSELKEAVLRYQRFYGLKETGEIGVETFESFQKVYGDIIRGLPQGYEGNKAKIYPGYYLSEGLQNSDVADLQRYLARIGSTITALPEVAVTGRFDSQTRNAVETFQRLFGLPVTGAVGPVTWYRIALEYDNTVE